MTDAVDPPYVLEERGAVTPRRVVMFASLTRYTYKGLTKNTDGVLEIVAGPADVASVKLDFSAMLEDGERIAHAEVRGGTLQNARKDHLIFTVDKLQRCGRHVGVGVVFTTGERSVFHFIAKANPLVMAPIANTDPTDIKREAEEATTPIPSIWGGVEW